MFGSGFGFKEGAEQWRDVRYGARLGIRRVKNMMVNKISVLTMICATYVDGLGEGDLRTEDTCM